MSQQLDTQGEAHEALGTAVASYGQRVLSDPNTLGNLVGDLLPDLPRERSLLVTGAEAGVADAMRQHVEEQRIDPDTAVHLVARALSERRAIDPAAGLWVATEYARALGYQVRPSTAGRPGWADTAAAPGPVLAAGAAAAALGTGRAGAAVLAAGRSTAAVLAARRATARAILAAAPAVVRRSGDLVVRPEARADSGRHRGRAARRVPDRRHGRAHVPVHHVPPGRGPLGPARAEADAARDTNPDGPNASGRGGAPHPAAARGHRRSRDAVPARPPALRL
jgi:hypothetical protein